MFAYGLEHRVNHLVARVPDTVRKGKERPASGRAAVLCSAHARLHECASPSGAFLLQCAAAAAAAVVVVPVPALPPRAKSCSEKAAARWLGAAVASRRYSTAAALHATVLQASAMSSESS